VVINVKISHCHIKFLPSPIITMSLSVYLPLNSLRSDVLVFTICSVLKMLILAFRCSQICIKISVHRTVIDSV
jgi:hypothetical protein